MSNIQNSFVKKATVSGNTSPYEIELVSSTSPFAVDEYYEIEDALNNNPICRVVSSRIVTDDGRNTNVATAKIESKIMYPIKPGSHATEPSFANLKKYVMGVEPENGFILGEVAGTDSIFVPERYRSLVAMCKNGVMTDQTSVPFVFDYKKMFQNPHIGLFGGSGSGKTVALKVILEEMMKRNIGGIVLDPHYEMNFGGFNESIHKKYYHDFSVKTQIFTIGQGNFGVNFADLTSDQLILMMSFSGELSGPMDALVRSLHHHGMTLYEFRKLIDDLTIIWSKVDQGQELEDDEKKTHIQYVGKVPHTNTLIALSWRLNALTNTLVFDGKEDALVNAVRNGKMCVVRGTIEQMQIAASHLIDKAYQKRRAYIDSRETMMDADFYPPFIIAMDESHIFCPRNNDFSLTRKILKTIAQEGRKYGVFQVFATQRPSLLDETVVAQLANKFVFRLSIKEDIASISKETDLTQAEIMKLPYLSAGEAYVSSSIIGRCVFVRIRYGVTVSKTSINPFDEIEQTTRTLTDVERIVINNLPVSDLSQMSVIQDIKSKTGKTVSVPELNVICDELAALGIIRKESTFMGTSYIKVE